ncbi:hypothetical protein CYLTODRAFT_424136 [Cylindrobasidium torrendii FP15055 ss-10]|uniref:Uncharacterized protein n=1 Tax=Cylindrobasidium torrendii FP15055 ss-10 TaxID=1314674 RepID=A0A0D7B842_9AGAR|nr:hypothetical protein CYLTODRAFT_424136 [Cylindrobasidium torrendii FP15055 ss-10]
MAPRRTASKVSYAEGSDDERKRAPKTRKRAAKDEDYDSDALDEEEKKPPSKKAKRAPRKKKQESEDEEDDELEDGQTVVGVVIEAPKTGQVPAGQVSQNTFDFLKQLQDPKHNDRGWFKLHDRVFRQAETEWKDFVEAFADRLAEVDPQVPPLPPKDVIHRIYRDIRFSNDKTPYKTNFSATFSRSGRKGIFACYHIMIKPGNNSMIAAGAWCPGKNELATIRSNIQRNPQRLRRVISAPAFVEYFGPPEPLEDGSRQNIFGGESELKNAPKGVAKDHPDIDLLKCRSFAVSHRFLDSEVLDPDFQNTLRSVAEILRPFVHCLNSMMTIGGDDDDEDSGDGEGAEGEGEEDGEEDGED